MADTARKPPRDQPSERQWVVPTTVVNEHGEEVPSLENAQSALVEAAVILMRIGGFIQIVTKRVKLEPQGRFGERIETEMLVIQHKSHVPVMPKAEPVAAAEEPAE